MFKLVCHADKCWKGVGCETCVGTAIENVGGIPPEPFQRVHEGQHTVHV